MRAKMQFRAVIRAVGMATSKTAEEIQRALMNDAMAVVDYLVDRGWYPAGATLETPNSCHDGDPLHDIYSVNITAEKDAPDSWL